MSELMTIAEFARRCGLSAKMLRSYARVGLLEPAEVDPESGYRYYAPDQFEQARLVALLRRAGIAVADIAAFVADPSPQTLDLWDRGLAVEVQARRSCIAQARHLCGRTATSTTGGAMIEIRPMSDRDELAATFDLLGAQLAVAIDSTDWRFTDLADRWPADRRLMLVATDQGQQVGGLLAFRTDEGVTVRIIAVVDRHRHRGIGRRLVQHLEAEAGEVGASVIAAGTGDETIGFWHHLGYTPQLLLQWVHDPDLADHEIQALLAGPLAGLPAATSSYNGVPQLFVELDEPRLHLPETLDDLTRGCHVGFAIHKHLAGTEPTQQH